jgi:hydrogenase nickel incorporation protein HypA/HybF
MHELALIESVARLAIAEAEQRGAEAITAIHLRVGTLAGVDPDALRFAAQVVLADGLAATARLEIELVLAQAWCSPCAALFDLEAGLSLCPRCGASSGELRCGRELELAALELLLPDQPEPAGCAAGGAT